MTWLCVLIGLEVVAYAALTIGKPYLEEHGFRLPVMQRRDAFAPAPVDDAGRMRRPSSSSRSAIDDNKPYGGLVI